MPDVDVSHIAGILAAGGAAGAAIVKLAEIATSRGLNRATAAKTDADARATDRAADRASAATEVSTLREIIAEVRQSEAKKAERIDNLERRLDLLEERERHMLTRAAVHEAWDQMAFAVLTQMNPDHPPPPPLTERWDDRYHNVERD